VLGLTCSTITPRAIAHKTSTITTSTISLVTAETPNTWEANHIHPTPVSYKLQMRKVQCDKIPYTSIIWTIWTPRIRAQVTASVLFLLFGETWTIRHPLSYLHLSVRQFFYCRSNCVPVELVRIAVIHVEETSLAWATQYRKGDRKDEMPSGICSHLHECPSD